MATTPSGAAIPRACIIAADLIRQFEGCKLTAYLCPAGVATIGWGATGPGVGLGMTWTQDQADARLLSDVTRFHDGVRRMITVPVTDEEAAAMTSFAYNVGLNSFASSTLLCLLNAGRSRAEVAEQFARWTRAGGKVLKGLVTRRAAERDLFLSAKARAA